MFVKIDKSRSFVARYSEVPPDSFCFRKIILCYLFIPLNKWFQWSEA